MKGAPVGLFDWFRRARRAKPDGPLPEAALIENATVDGQSGRPALLFSSVEAALRTAHAVADQKEERPLLYAFQHYTLREAAFDNHPLLLRELAGEVAFRPLLHFVIKARLRCELAGVLELLPDDDGTARVAELELFTAVKIDSRGRTGYRIHVVHMPTPLAPTEAHFVAIVHKADEPHEPMQESPSTRYFTLEKSAVGTRPLLCEWRRDGTHGNYGEGPDADPEAFVAAILELIGTAGRPDHTGGR
jgi:hypothetical protein